MTARWIVVDNGGCQSGGSGPNGVNLTNFTTRDLYIRLDRGFKVLLMSSGFGSNAGLTFSTGPVFQHPNTGRDVFVPEPVPTEDDPEPAPNPPCLKFDSYFALGLVDPASIQFIKPSPFDAASPDLELVWFATPGASGADAIQNAQMFGDSQFYARVARFTVPTAAAVQPGSELEAGVVVTGGSSATTFKVSIPAFPN